MRTNSLRPSRARGTAEDGSVAARLRKVIASLWFAAARLGLGAAIAFALAACGPAAEGGARPPAAIEKAVEPAADAREAFASSGSVGGADLDARSLRSLASLAAGAVRAGPVSSGGRAVLVAAARDESGRLEERLLAIRPGEPTISSPALPAPATALAATGSVILTACADGSLAAFVLDESGPRLGERWRRSGDPITRLLPLPAERVAAFGEDASVAVLSAESGVEAWHARLDAPAGASAYAPGRLLVAVGAEVSAYGEKDGRVEWEARLAAPVTTLAASGETAAAIDERGRLTILGLDKGRVAAECPETFDPSIAPAFAGGLVVAARRYGGAAAIGSKDGAVLRAWPRPGAPSFVAADGAKFYLATGRRLSVISADADRPRSEFDLPAPPAAPPAAAGRILVLACVDGSVLGLGEPGYGPSKLEPAITPPAEIAGAMAATLEKYRARGGSSQRDYLRFDVFRNGMPVASDPPLTAFRFEPEASGAISVTLQPDPGDGIVVVFDDGGAELEGNRDELGTTRIARGFEKGRQYWIVAGRRGTAGSERKSFVISIR